MNNILWQPSEIQIKDSQMYQFMEYINIRHNLSFKNYNQLHQWSIEKTDNFWISLLDYLNPVVYDNYTEVYDKNLHMSKLSWFKGLNLNYAENLLQFRNNNIAIIFVNELGVQKKISYKQLYLQVATAINYLRTVGVTINDRVAGYLPNMPEAIIWMLATTAIGAIWSSTSPDFGAAGALDRFGQIAPKVLICVDGYYYNGKTIDISAKVQTVIDGINSLKAIVVVPYIGDAALLLQNKLAVSHQNIITNDLVNENVQIEFAKVDFNHPAFILYSSGTTGLPKTIVHRGGGVLLTHLKEHHLHSDLTADDVLFYFTTTGWMMWNWLVSGLATGATIICYDGSPNYPSNDYLWQLAEQLKITIFGTSAKYLADQEANQVMPKYDLSHLRVILSTGSVLADHSFDYVYNMIKKDLLLGSISGGTDIISCFCLANPMLAVCRGEAQSAGLGCAISSYNEKGEAIYDTEGELVCTLPLPSMPLEFWHDVDGSKFYNAYFNRYPNIWYHGDYIVVYRAGGIRFLGRSDATLNPQGVRIGTAEIYQALETMDEIVDSIAIGRTCCDDEQVNLFVQLKIGLMLNDDLIKKIKQIIRDNCTPRHVPHVIYQITDVPYTINGKKVELAVKNIINGKEVKNSNVLKNPESLNQFKMFS